MNMVARIERADARRRPVLLTTYVDRAELERQFRRAQAGERVVYARGTAPVAGSLIGALVRGWSEQGLCHLLRERDGGDGFRYLLQKRPLAVVTANVVSIGRSICGRPEQQLLNVLIDIADAGRAMPSLDLLADRADLPHRQAVAYRLRLLVEGGFVRIRHEGVSRFAEILKEGPAR